MPAATRATASTMAAASKPPSRASPMSGVALGTGTTRSAWSAPRTGCSTPTAFACQSQTTALPTTHPALAPPATRASCLTTASARWATPSARTTTPTAPVPPATPATCSTTAAACPCLSWQTWPCTTRCAAPSGWPSWAWTWEQSPHDDSADLF